AEDGIRDFHVTGVQTCALPISEASSGRLSVTQSSGNEPNASSANNAATRARYRVKKYSSRRSASSPERLWLSSSSRSAISLIPRSEERRVGKEGRPRRSRQQCR